MPKPLLVLVHSVLCEWIIEIRKPLKMPHFIFLNIIYPDVGSPNKTAYHTSLTSLIPTLPGYQGKDCSLSLSQCVSNPCNPEGTILCEELESTYRCLCHHGYTGTRCETRITHCVDGLCQHSSLCVDLSGGFKCDCLPGRMALQLVLVSDGGIPSNWSMYINKLTSSWCFHLFSFRLCRSLISLALSNKTLQCSSLYVLCKTGISSSGCELTSIVMMHRRSTHWSFVKVVVYHQWSMQADTHPLAFF